MTSLITKETTKRERDRIYCKNDIMEMETLRYYASNGDRKNLLRNIHIAAGIFLAVVVIIIIITMFFLNIDGNSSPMEYMIIFCILFMLSILLIKNIERLVSQTTTEYDNKITELTRYVRLVLRGLEKDSSNISFDSFDKLPNTFLIPFVERWAFMENINDIKTFKNRISDIDNSYDYFKDQLSVNKLIGLLRPYEKDIIYLYDAVRSSQKPSFPDLTEYEYIYRKTTYIEIISWVILVLLYYNVFHIYYQDTDMFVEIITAIIISILFLMLMYYLIIAKNSL